MRGGVDELHVRVCEGEMEIQESLNEILHSKDEFGRMFYEHFLETYPELQHHFARVNMKRQAVMLTTALMIIERYYSEATPAIELYLRFLGTKHHGLGVSTGDFPKFFDSLFQTLKRFHGEKWHADLERQWRAAIEQATSLMFEGYVEHVQV